MVPQELMNVTMQDHMREAARMRLERRALARQEPKAPRTRAPARLPVRWLPLPSFLACVFRSAPTS